MDKAITVAAVFAVGVLALSCRLKITSKPIEEVESAPVPVVLELVMEPEPVMEPIPTEEESRQSEEEMQAEIDSVMAELRTEMLANANEYVYENRFLFQKWERTGLIGKYVSGTVRIDIILMDIMTSEEDRISLLMNLAVYLQLDKRTAFHCREIGRVGNFDPDGTLLIYVY